MKNFLSLFKESSQRKELDLKMESGESVSLLGISPGFKPYLSSAMFETYNRTILLISATWNKCERMFEYIHPFMPADKRERLAVIPEMMEAGDHDLTPSLRLRALELISDGNPSFFVAPYKSLMNEFEDSESLRKKTLSLKVGGSHDLDSLTDRISDMGYRRNFQVEFRGEFARRGGILDIYPSTGQPVRLEFFGDDIDSIRSFDLDTQISTGRLENVSVFPNGEIQRNRRLLDILPRTAVIVVDDPEVIRFQALERDMAGENSWESFQQELAGRFVISYVSWEGRENAGGIMFNTSSLETFGGKIEKFIEQLNGWRQEDSILAVSTQQTTRFRRLFAERGLNWGGFEPDYKPEKGKAVFLSGDFHQGFHWKDADLRLICDKDILGAVPRIRRVLRAWDKRKSVNLGDLKQGDMVVHLSHGVGRFAGLSHLTVEGVVKDFVELEYRKGDKLFVPVHQMDLLSKYSGAEVGEGTLSRLGGKEWTKARQKAKASAEEMAGELIALYAERERSSGYAFSPDDQWQWELEASFPFEETPDQEKAIEEVKSDMEATRPMDRLLCGDVGYGKTEVALRASFKAVRDGRQVAVLVPTTILAFQHFESFRSRLAPFPVNVEMLSRFVDSKKQKEVLAGVATGDVDILIGTHRIFQKDMKFRNLGLLVVDEEHHFGVRHKEKIKRMKKSVDILTMTATPIPRTLNLSLSGIRDISVIETPPEERLPVKTHLMEYDAELVRSAIVRELERGGQVYFLHNRVQNIERIARDLGRLVPFAKIAVGHGQMDEDTLEAVMLDFLEGKFDVLVCTTIIGSGLDIPNVNTIIINDAQNFGLAQLYQLRGRVGRSNRQAYAYLLYPPHISLNESAQKRLEAIREFSYLGAGLQIAMKDLEIRGAGNILGAEQSGHIAAVGYDLYCQLLKSAVEEKKGVKGERSTESPLIDLPANSFIPDFYITDSSVKIEIYRKIARIEKEEEIAMIRAELEDRFGKIPHPLNLLLEVLRIKLLAWDLGVPYVKEVKREVQILLPEVRNISLIMLQKLYELSGVACYFHRSLLTLENLFGGDRKSLVPQKDFGKPEKWLVSIQKVLRVLLEWKSGGKI